MAAEADQAFSALEKALRSEAMDEPEAAADRIMQFRVSVMRLAERFRDGRPLRDPRKTRTPGAAPPVIDTRPTLVGEMPDAE